MPYARYAIYYTPPPGPFAGLGASLLGWDIALGRAVPHPELTDLPRPLAELTENPRRYGFHATLKPPFRLAPGADPHGLEAALRALAAGLAPVRLAGLRVGEIGSFVALLPQGDIGAADALEARLVEELDRFRDPGSGPTRLPAALTPAQQENLARWGYPYVMGEFRFHMTLAGPLDPPERAAVRAALETLFAPHCGRPLAIDDVTLVGEDAAGRFHELARIALSGLRTP